MPRELVLNFHGIGTPHSGVGPEERAVWMNHESFVKHLDHIAALRATNAMPIVITFDDGNRSDAEIALPELCKRGLEATFFLCAGRVGSQEYIGADAVGALLRAGMKIGSHGMHHRDWRKLDQSALAEELGAARKRLEDVSGSPVVTASVPFGSYDRRVLAGLRGEGYHCVYTSDRGLARAEAWLKARNTLGFRSSPEDVVQLLGYARGPKSLLRDALRFYKRFR